MGYAGTTDPYAYITIGDCEPQQTSKKENTLNPEWDEEFTFMIDTPLKRDINIKIYDDDSFARDDCIGEINFPLHKLKADKMKDLEKTIDMCRDRAEVDAGASAPRGGRGDDAP